MLHLDRTRAGSFGDDAERYERTRPGYPPALIEDLLAGGALDVLDVGCGTGITSRLFVERGCAVLGVEPDDRMAAVALGHGLHVEGGTFEDWEPAGRRFDLVVAGQAWHWVDPERGAAKAADVLRVPGRLAVFWNQGLLPAGVRSALDDVYRRLAPGLDRHAIALGHMEEGRFARVARALQGTGRFHVPSVRAYTWRREYTTERWLDQLPTHSDHHALPTERLDDLLAEVRRVVDGAGGRFDMTYRTWVVTAGRREA